MALAFPAGAIELALPVACTLGESCYIQQYPDHDPGPGASDFTCGPLSYDGHDGTDIALPDRAAMAAGVAVLAAAPGTIKALRDGMADFAPVIAGKECGNGVLIDHGDGWESQYCHMKQGSITARVGAVVSTGTAIGEVGQSGKAEFPHLHLSLRHNGQKIDPFAAGADLTSARCGLAAQDLWQPDLPFQPGGLLAIGLTNHLPDYETIKAGLPSPDLPDSAPALVVWAYAFGPRAGDRLMLAITGPDGTVIRDSIALEKTQSLAFRALGRKLRQVAWPAGPYQAEVQMLRAGTLLGQKTLTLHLGPSP